ncbi:hypothetical protein TNCV_2891411 [Trichonephila clavipes]|nr:hypothetical protein TNCV_2891411 [Trichonephila clavipes]
MKPHEGCYHGSRNFENLSTEEDYTSSGIPLSKLIFCAEVRTYDRLKVNTTKWLFCVGKEISFIVTVHHFPIPPHGGLLYPSCATPSK